MNQAKPFSIPKQTVWDAYKRIRQNQGASGVDEVSIRDFEVNLKDNLYKLWNRMSSGSYFPPAVRTVEIPKKSGGVRPLGIPTVEDRIAQMVVKMTLEPKVDLHFHPDSYGYRPKKSAHQALGIARKRCWQYDWVLDVDIKGFFDNLDHTLLMKVVEKHTDSKWVRLYIERWLKAPGELKDGTRIYREKGTPQGGVISPLLANLYLHYAFDDWMSRNHRHICFERYADDIVVHCLSEAQAKYFGQAIARRLRQWKLELNLAKTKVVYCKNKDRQSNYSHEKFDFLGYTFRTRLVQNKEGKRIVGFSPAISNNSAKAIRQTIRSWKLQRKVSVTLREIADQINPVLRGWIQYYAEYCKSETYPVFRHLDRTLVRWMMHKHKSMRNNSRRAWYVLGQEGIRNPNLFAHWQMGLRPLVYRR